MPAPAVITDLRAEIMRRQNRAAFSRVNALTLATFNELAELYRGPQCSLASKPPKLPESNQ